MYKLTKWFMTRVPAFLVFILFGWILVVADVLSNFGECDNYEDFKKGAKRSWSNGLDYFFPYRRDTHGL